MSTASAAPSKAAPKVRPKHLDLTKIKLPLPGFISILHRISGAGLFLMLPFLLWLLEMSLSTETSFDKLQGVLAHPLAKLVLIGLLWSYLHHFCAGIRFLLLDMHKGIDLPTARKSAGAVLFVSLPLTALCAWRLFF